MEFFGADVIESVKMGKEMNWPPGNEIVIDTNVFRHMCGSRPIFNGDGHCVVLLGNLASKVCVLLVDSAGYFYHEWRNRRATIQARVGNRRRDRSFEVLVRQAVP